MRFTCNNLTLFLIAWFAAYIDSITALIKLLKPGLSSSCLMASTSPRRSTLNMSFHVRLSLVPTRPHCWYTMALCVHLCPTGDVPLDDSTRYHHLVGSLVWLGITRPNIAHYVHTSFVFYDTFMKPFLICLFFNHSSSLQLRTYFDAAWASDSSDRPSLLAIVFFLAPWLSGRPKGRLEFPHSSVEADLWAMATVSVEMSWLWWLLSMY